MKIRTFILLSFLALAFVSCSNSDGGFPYQNTSLSFDKRAKDLLNRLTLEEKVSLMTNKSAAVERLGIPPYDWWNEALHGVARAGQATVFPQSIGLAATFDDNAVYEMFDIVSDEARAKHHDFKNKNELRRYRGLTFWTPNINIFRDPRWGRGMETYGEDPYLTGRIGVAAVRGLQGDLTGKYNKAHACAKHYAVHSGPEWNRHSYNAENISKRDLYETYLPAFKALVTEAKVKEVMCAYNRFEGKPCCGSNTLLVDILRKEWGYDNVVVSDCGAIDDFFREGRHGTHKTAEEAAADAVITGTDLECGGVYRTIVDACKAGLISEKQIDVAVFRLLRARFQLGLFDKDEDVSWSSIPYSVVESEEHKAKALEMARKSIVLLSNKNKTLPLSKDLKKVAVIGPNANDSVMLWANYSGTPTKTVTILQGIQAKLPEGAVIYEKGCDLVDDKVFFSQFNKSVYSGKQGFKATFWNTKDFTGDVAATSQISQPFEFHTGGNTVFVPGVNLNNFSAKFASTFTATEAGEVIFRISGSDGYRLTVGDQKVIDRWGQDNKSFKDTYLLKVNKGQKYPILIEFFKADKGNGALNFDFGYLKDINYEAVAQKVKDADAIVFVGGISRFLEGEEMSVNYPGFKGGDRTNIDLPQVQVNLLKALAKLGKPVVFVICTGSTFALTREAELTDAMINAWYGGQQGGIAVADVLFGDYNPAGRLPLTFYASSEQLPDFEDYDMSKGRTYRYFKGEPLYPFGYGLSYTTFEYGTANLSKSSIKKKETVTLSFDLKNTGSLNGDEVVQVYIRNPQDAEGPIKSLRAFKRINVKAGASESVAIKLEPNSFEFFDPQTNKMTVKPSKYEILYGGSSDDAVLKSITVTIV
ncbi:MAG: glycoside hydrolase family 3 C-terminal domain-containing protein [Prevotellaceae bacterium]|jgi:beta-glucosidase|nr:glycoside hydrolase family 3 C-terminal domain-containing protein [Prevotellaceae bacterium]